MFEVDVEDDEFYEVVGVYEDVDVYGFVVGFVVEVGGGVVGVLFV